MCTLALLHRRNDRWPLILLANRDEYYARPSAAPSLWRTDPPLWAGRDLRDNGTWLGINTHGVVAGLTNRFSPMGPAPDRPSRGQLPLIALMQPTAWDALAALLRLDLTDYNGFSMTLADSQRAFVVTNRPAKEEGVRHWEVSGGFAVLANDAADSNGGGKRESLGADFQTQLAAETEEAGLIRLIDQGLTRHDGKWEPTEAGIGSLPICVHTSDYGTVSSAAFLLTEAVSEAVTLWTEGPRCSNAWSRAQPFISRPG